jgi:hypothetical protein
MVNTYWAIFLGVKLLKKSAETGRANADYPSMRQSTGCGIPIGCNASTSLGAKTRAKQACFASIF